MGGIKRKEAPNGAAKEVKKQKTDTPVKKSRLEAAAEDDGDGDGFEGFGDAEEDGGVSVHSDRKANFKQSGDDDAKKFKLENGQSSAEAHAKQRQLAKERKAAKPNADLIQRSKKIWERLRRKSHVPLAERKELVAELFGIITGRVQDFVFKHDSVRVIQTGLKYGSLEQRKMIVTELKGNIRELVESKYGKFLVAKMVVEGDQEIRDTIIPEFYGYVKRFLNHPEASWIVDDIYRQIASPVQKATMLREWYGAEFALFHRKAGSTKAAEEEEETADLTAILAKNPEKRRPILEFLHQMINSLVQKKMTGFTMLHDAMLQYFLALTPGTEEHTEFLEVLKGDIETKVEAKESTDASGGGDLFRNLAFTKSGSRLVCLALAYGSAKDRKVILKCYKDHVEQMAYDPYAKMVLIAGYDCPDDTKMTAKVILSELLGSGMENEEQRLQRLMDLSCNRISRVPLLYPLAGTVKWLMSEQEKVLLAEVHEVRNSTSKKVPSQRRKELLEYLSAPLLELVSKKADELVQDSFGCQVISETLLEAYSEKTVEQRDEAKKTVARSAAGDPSNEGHVAHNAAVGRMLKTLVTGGSFDPETKTTKLAEQGLGFADALFPVIEEHLVDWACSPSSFVVVALLESEDVSKGVQSKVRKALEKGRKRLSQAAAGDGPSKAEEQGGAKPAKKQKPKGNAGARMLLQKLGE